MNAKLFQRKSKLVGLLKIAIVFLCYYITLLFGMFIFVVQ